jgi:hypothetical protein
MILGHEPLKTYAATSYAYGIGINPRFIPKKMGGQKASHRRLKLIARCCQQKKNRDSSLVS